MRTHEGPVAVFFYAFHEEVWNPECVEEVACALFFFTMVFLEVEKIKDVGMPRLDVDGERTFALAATLVNVACGVIEDAKHWYNAVRGAVCAFDVRTCGADVVDGQTNAAGRLRDLCTRLKGVVDAADAVFFHGKQEARRHLWFRRARIKECWCCVCKPTF